MNFIFTYGLLQSRFPTLQKMGLRNRMNSVGPASIQGSLVDLVSYPGLVPGQRRIHGELFQVSQSDLRSVLPILDDYEDFDPMNPGNSLYIRKKSRLIEPGIQAWVYWLNLEKTGLFNEKTPGQTVPPGRIISSDRWDGPLENPQHMNVG